ncbi:hypothetical protein ACVWXU_008716 [Streptomyces sp. TE33382]
MTTTTSAPAVPPHTIPAPPAAPVRERERTEGVLPRFR